MEPPSFFLHSSSCTNHRWGELSGWRVKGGLTSSVTVWAACCIASIIEGAVLISCLAAMKENHPYLLLMALSGDAFDAAQKAE